MTTAVPTTPEAEKDHFLSNKAYDVIKFLAQILLPAVGTLYFALSGIWGFPDAEQVIGTITAVDTFLGVLLAYSTTSFNNSTAKYDGTINVTDVPGGPKTFTLELNGDPNDLDSKGQAVFKINPI